MANTTALNGVSHIPLYPYQIEISDELKELVLGNEVEINMGQTGLTMQSNSFYLTLPLGSGKTRIVARTIRLLLESPNIDERTWSFDFLSKTKSINYTAKNDTLIFLFVPSTLLKQWNDELLNWKLNFYTIATPKNIRPLSEIKERLVLISDYRTRDLKTTNFFDKKVQLYVFIDEYDTILINKKFVENFFPSIKSKVCVSANYDGNDRFSITQNLMVPHQLTVSKALVNALIALPPVIEETLRFSKCLILAKNAVHFDKWIVDNLNWGNINYIFQQFKLPYNSSLDSLFDAIIAQKKDNISTHLALTGGINDAYVNKMQDQCRSLKSSLLEHCGKCRNCGFLIPSLTSAVNCVRCYDYFCTTCASRFLKSNLCSKCDFSAKVKTDDLAPYSKDSPPKTRLHCLFLILEKIKGRKSVSSKKVLVYCTSHSLVAELSNYLQENNFWSIVLDGSSRFRNSKISQFKKADTDIYLVCNSIENSAGIHLPETTDIIIYHELEAKYDTQVVGRAQRIGRKDSLFLYRISD